MSDPQNATQHAAPQSELLEVFEKLTDLMSAGRYSECRQLAKQHPQYASELDSVLPAILVMEQAKSGDTLGVVRGSDNSKEDPHLQLRGRLGDFQLKHEIGRGGMGVVYEAEQLLLGRRVALKVLPFAAMLDERQRARFENEARAAATLNHPHIVPIYAVGLERGIHFYAMQLVEGDSLASLLVRLGHSDERVSHDAETRPEVQAQLTTQKSTNLKAYFQSIARIGLAVAQALEHAHQRGVVHRDIKPSNILLDAGSGMAMVTDFGLARAEALPTLTMTGDIIGTLRYAAPEQLLGERTLADERVDIYSLGATLYELLCLVPIRDGGDRASLLHQAVSHRPASLRSLNPSVPTDLALIVETCLEPSPEDRYASAEALAEDLLRFTSDRPIKTRRPSMIRRMSRWVRRHPSAMIAGMIVLLLFAIGATAGMLLLSNEQRRTLSERDRANRNLQLAMATLDEFSYLSDTLISTDGQATRTQELFLRQTASRLEEIAQGLPEDEQMLEVAGFAHMRAAGALRRIHEYDKAILDYRKAVELLQKVDANDSQNRDLFTALASCEGSLGQIHLDRGEPEEAARHLQNAAEYTHSKIGFLGWQYEIARASALQGEDDAVLRQVDRIQKEIDSLLKGNPDLLEANLLLLHTMTLA